MIWNDMTANVKMYGNTIAFNEVSGSIWLEGAGCYFEDVDGEILFANNLVYNNFYTGNINCHGTGLGISSNTRLSIINNTITGNEASPYGGALSTRNTISTVALNNIFWGNSSGPSMPEVDILAGSPPEIVYCDVQGGWTGTGNIDINPELMDTVLTLSDTLFAILSINSPCIDAGDPDAIYNDPEDPNNLGYALFPSRGTIRNDMGAYGGPGAKKWRIVTDVNEEFQFTNEIPTAFKLLQNYPNPFNPSTTIRYNIPQLSFVTLKVYDVLGNEIETLVNEEKPIGNYEIEFNANNLSSGIYFYQIKADSYVETKKMILLK
jgi:hypothetical protein